MLQDSDGVDPRHDPRPEAASLFNPAFVSVPSTLRSMLVATRKIVKTEFVVDAWAEADWGAMQMTPLVGKMSILARKEHFLKALPHLGTSKVAYHARQNWVCREYGFVAAAIVAAELEVNAGIVCDFDGHHLYSFVPVVIEAKLKPEILIIEPQTDRVVKHTDPSAHYVGKAGFALLI